MSFTRTQLANNAVLVEGTDVRGNTGSEVVFASEWEDIRSRQQYQAALTGVDEAIAEVLAPIQAAVNAANEANQPKKLDPLFYFTEQEGSPATEGKDEVVTRLSRDTVILRALEEGLDHRLLWVNDMLVVTAESAPAPEPEDKEDSFGNNFTD